MGKNRLNKLIKINRKNVYQRDRKIVQKMDVGTIEKTTKKKQLKMWFKNMVNIFDFRFTIYDFQFSIFSFRVNFYNFLENSKIY